MIKLKFFGLLLIFVTFLISFFSISASAQLIKAWDSFKENDYKQAIVYCDKSIKESGNEAKEALLLKAIISAIYSDNESILECMEKFIEKSNEINPYIFGMWLATDFSFDPNNDDSQNIDYWENLSENPQLNGTMKSWIYETIARRYKSKYKYKDAKKFAGNIGVILDWQVTGTFENISESGFDKSYGVLEHPEPNYKFVNKNGAEVTWFDKVKPFDGDWINLNDNFIISNSIIFAQTFFSSETEGFYQLRMGTSGSLKAWVNDFLVLSVPEERNNGIDTYIAKIKIHKGMNRILLQLGSSEIQSSNFLVRITQTNGEVLKGLTFTTKYSQYLKEKSFETEISLNFAEESFKSKIKNDSTNLINYILLANCLLTNEKLPEARHILLNAQKLAPNSSYILNQLANVYYRLNDRTDQSLMHEKLRKTDPNFPFAIESEFDEAISNEKYEIAAKFLEKLENVTKNTEKLYLLGIKLNALEKKAEKFISLIESAYKRFPDSYSVVALKYILEKKIKNDIKAGISVLKKFVDKNNNNSAISDIASEYKTLGKNSEFFSLLEDIVEINPNKIGYIYDIAIQYFDSRDYESAVKYLKKCIEIAPFVAAYHHELGNAYKEMNKTELAIQEYNECIRFNPFHFAVREKLRQLNNKKPLFDYLEEPDLHKIFNDNLTNNFNRAENAIVLIDQTNKVVYSGGASEERSFLLVKVLSPKGIDAFKEYSIFTYPNQDYIIEKAEVLKKNGDKLKAQVKKNDIVFPNLTEGDAILLTYKIQNYQFGALSKYFWNKKTFDSYYSCLDKKYSLLISSDEKFDYSWSNSDYKPEISKVEDYTVYTWERKNKIMIISELYMPSIVDYAELLDISTIKSWDFISKWYYDIVNSKAKSKFETKEVIRELFPNGTPKDKLTAVKSIYEYIVKNIRYSHVEFLQSGIIPQKASDVLNSKMGDCKDVSTLLVALCREIGIEANWVLVCTSEHGKNYLKLPSIDFNHCIASVDIDGKKYYIELTSDKLPFGNIGGGLLGALALEISDKKENTLFVLNPEERLPNAVHRNIEVTFENDIMKVDVNTIKLGGTAARQRSTYRDLSHEEQRKEMAEAIGSEYPQITLLNLKFENNLNTLSDSCSYNFSFKVDNIFTVIGGLSAFKIPYIDGLTPSQAFSTNSRKYPFDLYEFSNQDSVIDEIKIVIPDGMTLAEEPDAVNIETKYGSYSLDFNYEDNLVTIKRRIITKKDIVPSDEFLDIKNFFQTIIKNDSKQIAFKKI